MDKVLQKLVSILGVRVAPYTPDVDPTRVIKRCLEMGLQPKNVDWTITASSITKLKAQVEERKGKKTETKPKNTRKRRRPANQEEDSSSDESEIPKPKFTYNDEEPRRNNSSQKEPMFGAPLDLSAPVIHEDKKEIKLEPVDDAVAHATNGTVAASSSTSTSPATSSPLRSKLEDIIVNLKREHELNGQRNQE